MDATKPQTISQFLRDLGFRLERPSRLEIGDSTSPILCNVLSRQTDDIDFVDGLPPSLIDRHALFDDLLRRYGSHFAHFQSHFLPTGLEEHLGSLGRFEKLDVFLVDPCDVLLSKLFSPRDKGFDDLRAALRTIDKAELTARLKHSGGSFLAEPRLAEHARRNWNVLFGETLPVPQN